MTPFRVGIIGCGPRAAWHADALRRMEEVDLVGAADPREDRLIPFCEKWEIPHRYAGAGDLLEAQRLDLVTIVTLPGPRPDLVCLAAEAGVPAINAEKVITYDTTSLDRMLGAAERAGALLTINHQMRFMPQFVAVRELVRSGRLGDVTFLRAGSRGNLMEQGTHVVDQMLFMNDDRPASWVMGQGDGVEGYSRSHPCPSTGAALMAFDNGVHGALLSGMLAPEVDPTGGFWLQKFVEVTGTKGWAGAYVNSGWRAVLDSGEAPSGPGTWEPNWPWQAELFRTALRWTRDRSIVHPCRAEVAARGLEILLSVCQSSLDRRAVLPPITRGRDVHGELKAHLGPAHGLIA